MSRVLIFACQTRVSRNISVQNGGELTRQTIVHMVVPYSESGYCADTIVGACGWRATYEQAATSPHQLFSMRRYR